MKKIVAFSTKHPISVVMGILTLILLGILGMFFIPVDFLPKTEARNILVVTEYPGISAKEMRRLITIPVEDFLASLKGLKQMSSISRDGLSLINLELHWNTDIDLTVIECRELIDINYEKLPSQCKKPSVIKQDAVTSETLSFVLIPKDEDLLYARHIADTDIKPRLQRVKDVGSVTVTGGEKEEIHVMVFLEKMETKNLTLQSVAEKIGVSNYEYPAGMLMEGELELLFKTSGLYTSLDDIRETPLEYNEGGLIKVSDIADVKRSVAEKHTFFLYDNKPAVKVDIYKKQSASPVSVASDIRRELENINRNYGSWCTVHIISDSSTTVIESLKSVLLSALIGACITFIIIWAVLRCKTTALILASMIPVSLLSAVFILSVTGKTLNIMSLSGIAIGIGMVVDAGAIVLENIQESIRDKKIIRSLINTAVEEVALSNIASTATTLIVFLPVFFVQGIVNAIFTDMVIAIISSISISCLLSLTYIPAMFYLCAQKIKTPANDIRIIEHVRLTYAHVLQRILHTKRTALIIMLVCIAAGCAAFRFVRAEFLPPVATNRVQAEIEFPNGTSVSFMETNALHIMKKLSAISWLNEVYISGGLENTDYTILSDPKAKKEKITIRAQIDSSKISFEKGKETIKDMLQNTDYRTVFTQTEDMLSSVLNIKNSGIIVLDDSPEASLTAAKNIAASLQNSNVYIYPNEQTEEYIFTPDRIANSRFGITAMYAASIARSSLEGVESSPYYENGLRIPIWVKLYDRYIQNTTSLENIAVLLQNGTSVPLRSFGTITKAYNEKVLYRNNRKDARFLDSETKLNIPMQKQPQTIDITKTQISEMTQNAVFLIAAALMLLYLVMAAQFESFFIPLLLLLALPPAFSGAFIFLAVFGKTLNINSTVALIILFGTAVNNSILLYETVMHMREKNKNNTADSICSACIKKFRAVLITTVTTIASLLPFAVDPANKTSQSSLALAIIGGLIVSSLIVLLVVPAIFKTVLKEKHAHIR